MSCLGRHWPPFEADGVVDEEGMSPAAPKSMVCGWSLTLLGLRSSMTINPASVIELRPETELALVQHWYRRFTNKIQQKPRKSENPIRLDQLAIERSKPLNQLGFNNKLEQPPTDSNPILHSKQKIPFITLLQPHQHQAAGPSKSKIQSISHAQFLMIDN